MAKIVLPAGTDVAEMALFALDALPSDRPPKPDALASMEAQGTLLRFPTGSDGGYLLHAYVNEPIPEEVMKYCVANDNKTGVLRLSSGRVGFGGLESLFTSFKQNVNIRSDSIVPAGEYEIVAFHIEYPDELIEEAVEAKLGHNAAKLLSLPEYIIPIALLVALIALILKAWVVTAAIVFLSVVGLKALFFSNPRIKRLRKERTDVELNYPSMVVEMRGNEV